MTIMRKALVLAAAAAVVCSLAPRVAEAAPETIRIYRLYCGSCRGDHMSSSDRYEASWGYYAESSMLYYAQAYGGNGDTPAPAHPVYRCYIWGWDHMDSLASNCEIGVGPEAVLGYLLDSWAPNHVGLYRCRQGNGEHFNSTDAGCEGQYYDGFLGWAPADGFESYPQAALNQGGVSNDCLGRCGVGCGWMPWEAWTSECYAHDVCVQNHGYLAPQCLVSFIPAAISYVWAGVKSLVHAVVDFVSSIFSWF
jgi:hypothetical protein